MKNLKINILSITLLSTLAVFAQDMPSEVTNEVAEKTIKIEREGAIVENSVKISTEIRQAVMTDKADKGEINGSRVFPPKMVIKTVEIDNDNDAMYDEKIKFSYTTDERTDFTLISNKDDLMIAVEDGNNITVLENQSKFVPTDTSKTSYVFTDEKGNEIEFTVEEDVQMDSK